MTTLGGNMYYNHRSPVKINEERKTEITSKIKVNITANHYGE